MVWLICLTLIFGSIQDSNAAEGGRRSTSICSWKCCAENNDVLQDSFGELVSVPASPKARRCNPFTVGLKLAGLAFVGVIGWKAYVGLTASEDELRQACLDAQEGVKEVLNVTDPLYKAVMEMSVVQQQMQQEQAEMFAQMHKEMAQLRQLVLKTEEECRQCELLPPSNRSK